MKNSIAIGGLNFDPTKYKLLVEGTIGARKLKITQLSPWPDYVFQADYPLPSLSYVERFVRNNKRLPDIPSQEEIMTDGSDVGEMNRLLMLKVEELTLYIIELNKKVEVLQALHQERPR
ncbi:hypothetical protein [Chitinophaga sp. MM2321]|uniref:hypothetical protein n=1 Tax=Chitinophaga sp. MM2321 TaxID=3137178 RepID=UPI0032D5A970